MANNADKKLLVGCAAGFSGDRTDAAQPVVQALIASGQPAVLIFETLAERTLALAQLARRTDPNAGYEPLLVDLLRPVLVGNRLKLHTVLAFLAVVGGLMLFGPAGLILGPLALTVTMALLEIWSERGREP